ncbi:uncharacterized protein LOC108848070 [Raphanus sativus]|uniref:Uncharacterized protein LOC108848070 n=1 Tax=Raphanus sativus TaxID=3726 RepID=A0A9W3C4L1_RAPSA|nr:uncharacterized protein LOC108848070 [Raphanus sativus]
MAASELLESFRDLRKLYFQINLEVVLSLSAPSSNPHFSNSLLNPPLLVILRLFLCPLLKPSMAKSPQTLSLVKQSRKSLKCLPPGSWFERFSS